MGGRMGGRYGMGGCKRPETPNPDLASLCVPKTFVLDHRSCPLVADGGRGMYGGGYGMGYGRY